MIYVKSRVHYLVSKSYSTFTDTQILIKATKNSVDIEQDQTDLKQKQILDEDSAVIYQILEIDFIIRVLGLNLSVNRGVG